MAYTAAKMQGKSEIKSAYGYRSFFLGLLNDNLNDREKLAADWVGKNQACLELLNYKGDPADIPLNLPLRTDYT